MVGLGGEAHGGAVAASGTGGLVKGTASVPGKTKQDRAEAAIVIVVLLLETGGNVVVDLLEVLLGGVHDLGRSSGGRIAGSEVPASTTKGGSTEEEGNEVRGLLGSLGGVESVALLTERLTRSDGEGVASSGSARRAREGTS